MQIWGFQVENGLTGVKSHDSGVGVINRPYSQEVRGEVDSVENGSARVKSL